MPSRRPAHALALAAACLVAGCGGDGGGAGGPGADKLEALIKVDTAQALLTDTGVPTPPADSPRVEEAIGQIDVDCESTGSRRYECVIDYGGDVASHCAMEANASITRILWWECGAERPPEVKSEYVDCDSVGDVVTAEDAIDTPEPLVPPPTGDLKLVKVAANSNSLCVEWQGDAPVERPLSVHFWANPSSGADGPSLTGSLEEGRPPHVGAGAYGSRDGTLGVRDSSVSLVIDRDELPEPQQAVLDGSFTFTARAFGDALAVAGAETPRYP
jgi:hypothetical protein